MRKGCGGSVVSLLCVKAEKAKQEGFDVEKERKLLADLYIELAKYMMQYE